MEREIDERKKERARGVGWEDWDGDLRWRDGDVQANRQ